MTFIVSIEDRSDPGSPYYIVATTSQRRPGGADAMRGAIHALKHGTRKTWCGLNVQTHNLQLIVNPRWTQHTTCKRCRAAMTRRP